MSNVKKTKKLPVVKEEGATEKSVPKKRPSRAKKQMSKEETMKLLLDELVKIKQDIQDLKEDETKLSGIQLKYVSTLIQDELTALEEELQEVEDNYEKMKSLPADEEQTA